MDAGVATVAVVAAICLVTALAAYFVDDRRTHQMVGALWSATGRWVASRGGAIERPVGDPRRLVGRALPRRIDSVLLAIAAPSVHGHPTVLAFTEDDADCATAMQLISLDAPGTGKADRSFSSGFKHGRRQWAEQAATRLGLDARTRQHFVDAAVEIDGSLRLADDRLDVLHFADHRDPEVWLDLFGRIDRFVAVIEQPRSG